MFKSKEAKSKYCFIKETDEQYGEVSTLYNYKNKPVYKAYITQEGQDESTYCFHDILKNKKTDHTVGKTFDMNNNSTYRMAAFSFDGVEIWNILAQNGITLRMTSVNKYDTVFRIFQDGDFIGSACMHKSHQGKKTIKIESHSLNTKLIFLIYFTIARIY